MDHTWNWKPTSVMQRKHWLNSTMQTCQHPGPFQSHHRIVRNPGISYSDLLILIPGSRVINTWSLFTLFILRRSRSLSMMSLWHHRSRLLSLIYGIILTPYNTIIRIHHISQWPLSLLSIIRAVYLFISSCTHMYKQYWAVYKTGLTASHNNKLSCSHSLIITALSTTLLS